MLEFLILNSYLKVNKLISRMRGLTMDDDKILRLIELARKSVSLGYKDEAIKSYSVAVKLSGNSIPSLLIEAGLYIFENNGDYKIAYEMWINAYRQEFEQDYILNLLTNAFYTPNEAKLIDRYNKNIRLLKNYEYIFSKDFPDFKDLQIMFYPYDENIFFLYDKYNRTFNELINIQEKNTEDLFYDLSSQLLIREKYSQYDLQYLVDNVRKSEDFGGDNHIYLYYESYEEFCSYMQIIDFTKLCKDKKIVLIFGEDQLEKYYPLDFKNMYNIDYEKIRPQKLRIEEIKRMVLYCEIACSGMTFILPVLNKNPCIHAFDGLYFHRELIKNNKIEAFTKWMSEIEKNTDIEQLISELEYYSSTLYDKEKNLFINQVKEICRNNTTLTPKEFFIAVFIAKFYCEEEEYCERITPTILYEPHALPKRASIYLNLVNSFEYGIMFNAWRDPIQRFASNIRWGALNSGPGAPGFVAFGEYTYYSNIISTNPNKCYSCRFEDAKLKPIETFKSICRVFGVPFYDYMINKEENISDYVRIILEEKSVDKKVFDTAAVKRNIDHILSDFDQLRLKMLFSPMLKYFGYEYFDFEYYKLTNEQVVELFKFPFKFEDTNKYDYNFDVKILRKNMFNVMEQVFLEKQFEKMNYPILIKP